MKITLVGDVTPCRLVDGYQRFEPEERGNAFSEKSVGIYWTTRRHIAEDSNVYIVTCQHVAGLRNSFLGTGR
jgi:hypothetical protein